MSRVRKHLTKKGANSKRKLTSNQKRAKKAKRHREIKDISRKFYNDHEKKLIMHVEKDGKTVITRVDSEKKTQVEQSN